MSHSTTCSVRSAVGGTAAIFLLALVACGGGEAEASAEGGPPAAGAAQSRAPSSADASGLGEIMAVGDLAVAVVGWDWSDESASVDPEARAPVVAAEGHRYLAVDVVVANRGPEAVLANASNVRLTDGAGAEYRQDMLAGGVVNSDATLRNPPDGELVPGERMRGHYIFEVPDGADDFALVYRHGVGRDASGARAMAQTAGAADEDLRDAPKGASSVPEATIQLGSSPSSVAAPELGEAAPASSGQAGDWSFEIDRVEYPTATDDPPPTGLRYVVVHLVTKNLGSGGRAFPADLSGLRTHLKDSAGSRHEPDMAALLAAGITPPNPALDRVMGRETNRDIPMGGTGTTSMGFLVPEDAGTLFFVFDPEPAKADGKAFVPLPT